MPTVPPPKTKARAKTKAKAKTPAPAPAPPAAWVLYVLRCQDGTLYCGITNHLARRLAMHDSGKGARYTRGRGPVVLLKSWPAVNVSAALKAERAFKKLTREAKERKIRSRARKDDVSRLLRGEALL